MSSAATPPGLSERDVSYLKLLKTLKQSPSVTEGALGVVRRLAAWIDSVAVLNFIAAHQGWFDDWEVKEALVHNDETPARFRVEIEKAIAIFDLLREMDDPSLTAQDKVEIQEDIKYLFKTLPEHDRGVVKQHAYQLSASRHGKPASSPAAAVARSAEAPAPASLPAPIASRAPDAAPAHDLAEPGFDEGAAAFADADSPVGGVTEVIRVAELEAFQAAEAMAHEGALPQVAFDEPEVMPEGVAGLAGVPVERKLALAQTTTDEGTLGLLAYDTSDQVLIALVQNPAMNDRLAAIVARRASTRVAEAIYRQRRLFMRPLVRDALFECANAPSVALLEAINSIGDMVHLLRLIKSPKVRFLEVKAKARARLSMMFKSLGTGEKIAAIRRAGSPLLKELWTDFFRDEALVVQCVQERQVDQGIVMEIARSKIAPRRALELIGTSPQWTANYQICLELVLNPKTPRQIVTKLIPKLNPADRKMIKNNAALPEAIRKFA